MHRAARNGFVAFVIPSAEGRQARLPDGYTEADYERDRDKILDEWKALLMLSESTPNSEERDLKLRAEILRVGFEWWDSLAPDSEVWTDELADRIIGAVLAAGYRRQEAVTLNGLTIEDWQKIASAKDEANAASVAAIDELADAIRLTVEYVGNDTLPPIEGWSWFDALMKYRPEIAEEFERNPILLYAKSGAVPVTKEGGER